MQEKQKSTGLVWFRNDLRVEDNYILNKASKNHKYIIAVYCFNPTQFTVGDFGFKKTDKFRAKFLIETIENLKINLAALNIELFVFKAAPESCIQELVTKHKVTHIYSQKEWTYEEEQVFYNVVKSLPSNVVLNSDYDQFLFPPDAINMPINSIPKVFTNFRKHVEKQSSVKNLVTTQPLCPLENLKNETTIPRLKDLGFENFDVHPNSAFPFNGGEDAAINRLNNYFFETKKLGFYKKTRNGLIGTDFSSKFSPWLANGSISARTIYWKVKQFEKEHYKNQSTYWLIFELIWRDYFKYVALKHENNIFKIGGILNKNYDWSKNETEIQRWINGKTKSDFVNANMIELKKTGWMSNRGRQNVASFFAKDLKLDWRIGAAYFESLLVDYDVHSNYGNWMYVAGVGNDPRDRTFNVALQAERYDSNGKFQAIWLQERLF